VIDVVQDKNGENVKEVIIEEKEIAMEVKEKINKEDSDFLRGSSDHVQD